MVLKLMAESIVTSTSKISKVFNLGMTNESLRQSLFDGGVNKATEYHEFMKMKFKLEGNSVSGQTLLRNFGSGRRSSDNFRSLCRKLDIELNFFAREEADFSDPKIIKQILEQSKVKVSSMKFFKFKDAKIVSDLFEGNGTGLLLKYEHAKAVAAGYSRKAVRIAKKTSSSKKQFVQFIEDMGVTNKYYSSLLENKKLLRKMFLSSGFDFERDPVFLFKFLKMKFKCNSIVRGGKDTITGQGLLLRCFGHKKTMNLENVETMLTAAGFNTANMAVLRKKFRGKHMDLGNRATKEVVRSIISSYPGKVDWANISFREFKFLRFSSPRFKGIGFTLLNRLGGATSTRMRHLLSLAGYVNQVPKKWENRLKRLEEAKKKI